MKNYNKETTKFFKILGRNIKETREEQKISIIELSQKTKIRKEYLKKIEEGTAYGISTTKFFIIADALNVKPHLLISKKSS